MGKEQGKWDKKIFGCSLNLHTSISVSVLVTHLSSSQTPHFATLQVKWHLMFVQLYHNTLESLSRVQIHCKYIIIFISYLINIPFNL